MARYTDSSPPSIFWAGAVISSTCAVTLRSSAWVLGEFLDEVIYGLLAEDWLRPPTPSAEVDVKGVYGCSKRL